MRTNLLVLRWTMSFTLLVFSLPLAFGWGESGHQMINRAAAEHLPTGMPKFLQNAAGRIAYLGPEPDRWREESEHALKASQEPDHYLDLELIAGMDLPPDRYQFFRALEQRRAADPDHADRLYPERVGLQPYITAEVYGRLKAAFRAYRQTLAEQDDTTAIEQDIVLYMGWLGHYVADGSNPMHTTVNYNGWVQQPNPHHYRTAPGLHFKMESDFVEANLSRLQFGNLMTAPRALNDEWKDYLNYLQDSFKLVERVYQFESAKGIDGQGTEQSREFIRQRMAAGASMLRDLWYTAWVESARKP